MKDWIKKPIAMIASVALAASVCAAPATAFAAGGLSGSVGDTTNWKVPTSQMSNYVLQGEGKDMAPYKVITTWANAWALSGPDYLGISNSGPLNQQGGGSASSNLANAQNDTLLGIWASSANEVPNAYNWNFFYNLSLAAQGEEAVDWSAIDVQNGSSPGFDSESGVWAPFKYRPEIIWTSNSLSSASAEQAVALIKAGKYYTENSKETSLDKPGTEAEASEYALPGDSDYSPYIMGATNLTPLTFTDSFYTLAGYAEQVIDNTKDYATKNADALAGLYEVAESSGRFGTSYSFVDNGINWKTANLLPRTTRYVVSGEAPMTARECALAVEKVSRGAVYYVLGQINDGKVAQKKVAFLTGDPSNGAATVVKYDFVDSIGQGPTGGKTGVAALCVDQLTTDTVVAENQSQNDYVTYTTYTATADDLASCDYVVDANGSMTANQIQSWVAKNVSSYAMKQRALNDVQYLTNSPAIMNGHNFTTEKMIWGAFNLDFFYPELFPNMELTTWWYDNVYHLNANNVKTAMQWGLANASLPAETNLTSLGRGYSTADLDGKFKEGFDFFQEIKGTEPYSTEAYATLAPSDDFVNWAAAEPSFKDTITVTGTPEYSAKVGKSFTLDAEANIANAELTYTSADKDIAKVNADGKVTMTGAGTTTITVTASKNRYEDGQFTIEVTGVKVAQPMKVKAKTVSVKAGKSVTAKKAFTVTKKQGKVTYKKTSGNTKITVTSSGKIKVKKGLKKGTYKVKVKVTAAGNAKYEAGSKTVTVKVKVTG